MTVLTNLKLNQLQIGLRAFFYHADTRLTPGNLKSMLLSISTQGRILEKTLDGWSVAALVREHEPPVAFAPQSGLRERRYSVVLLAASGRVLTVQTSGAGRWAQSVIEDFASRFDADAVASSLSEKAVLQKLNLRSMSSATNAIRRRVLESPSLDSAMSPAGTNRQIAESVRVRKGDRLFSGTPATGRLAEAAARLSIEEYLSWCSAQSKSFLKYAKRPGSIGFFARFARVVDMAHLDKAGIMPTSVLLGLEWLVDGLLRGTYELGTVEAGEFVSMKQDDARKLLHALGDVGEVGTFDGEAVEVVFPDLKGEFFRLKKNKHAFRLTGALLNKVHVRDVDAGEHASLGTKIVAEESLFVTMSDVQYAYSRGRLFRDAGIGTQAPIILQALRVVKELAGCDSEKGDAKLKPSSTNFPDGSVFRVVEGHIATATEDSVLVCDDLVDEWADFVGIRLENSVARISLYHAKHKEKTTSASALHDVVGQALKNLGRRAVNEEELVRAKTTRWAEYWAPAGSTKIRRVRRGGGVGDAIAAYVGASNHPASRARICLVLSFMSKAEVEEVLQKVAENTGAAAAKKLKPHQVQLVHLLVVFISEVRQYDAEPVIYCAP